MRDATRRPLLEKLFDTLWIDEGALRSLWIHGDSETPRVSVWRGMGPQSLLVGCVATWQPRREPESPNPRRRLDVLQVEAGLAGTGSTYDLMLAMENDDPARCGGLRNITADDAAPLTALRLFPEVGASFYAAVLGEDDDFTEQEASGIAWAQPYRTYRMATDDERKAHRGGLLPRDT
ncbi:MAG: hypothetical protein H6747_07765 [Deltaproteobacteria bacterium]|nr:hypothetical protein [Deltaproteobacteria bacterium]